MTAKDNGDTPKGSLNILISMVNGLWRFDISDHASFFGCGLGFVSPERAFAAALEDLEDSVVRAGGFDTGQKVVRWVDPDGRGSDGSCEDESNG